jgi:putative FmdB family regulatory protein
MTYEYACTACGHAWEAEQSISAAPLTECPHCHEATAKRQVSGGAGFILKGGGWYADLYSSSKPGSSESKASTESKPATESKPTTESKPASTESKSDSSGSSSSGSSGSSGSGSSTTGAAST